MGDYNDSALDNHLDSLNRDLESIKSHLDSQNRDLESIKSHLVSFMSSYDKVSNCNRIMDQHYADLKKCVEDYNYALKLLLEDYGDLLTLSLDPEESADYFKKRIQDKLENLKRNMADRDINLQYRIPREQYVDTDDKLSLDYVDTTEEGLDGVVLKIACIGLNSDNIKGDREVRESTVVYRYRDSSDSSISDTSAKEGAPTTDGVISKQSSADSDSRNTGAGSGNQEETSHEADSTNQTDENRHVLADVDAPLHLIDMDRNPDGKYELPLDEDIKVGISGCSSSIARFSVPSSIATDLKITLTEDDTSLSLELAPEGYYYHLTPNNSEISYGTCFLNKQKGYSDTNVTYTKTNKPIEYYAHVTDTENAEDVKLEVNGESPSPFVHVVDGKWLYYHPSEDEPHWRESTESVLKYIADYTIGDFERYVRDLYDNMGVKKSVKSEIHKLILTSGGKPEITPTAINEKVDSILTNRKKS